MFAFFIKKKSFVLPVIIYLTETVSSVVTKNLLLCNNSIYFLDHKYTFLFQPYRKVARIIQRTQVYAAFIFANHDNIVPPLIHSFLGMIVIAGSFVSNWQTPGAFLLNASATPPECKNLPSETTVLMIFLSTTIDELHMVANYLQSV